jgi:thiol:disulfide interchange protein DsbD
VEKKLQLALEISAEEALPLSPALQQRLKTDTKPPPVQVVQVPASLTKPAPPGPGATESGKPAPGKLAADTGFWALIFLSISAGFFSILTPCVLPVIPLTVSFFLKQAEQRKMRPLTMATVFSLTIVVVLTAGGLLFLEVLEAVIAHWGTNLFLGGLFIFFALSLFGMYEIGLPESLSQFTQSREERGGVIGTIFMALTFTIISFACIGPIYASCLALAATGSVTGWLKALAATLAYSISFAAPFFFLALFPGMLRSVPRSGSWMNTIKVVLGFLILAVSFTFLSGAEFKIYGKNAYLTYDLVLGILVALSLLCGFYLLGLYRLPHDEPMEHLGVPRLLCSLVFLSLGFYLLPGLFKSADGEKQRPAGALFDGISLLLPRPPVDEGSVALPSDGKSRPDGAPAGGRLRWIGNLQRGLDEAKQQQRLVFLDFTGFD